MSIYVDNNNITVFTKYAQTNIYEEIINTNNYYTTNTSTYIKSNLTNDQLGENGTRPYYTIRRCCLDDDLLNSQRKECIQRM